MNVPGAQTLQIITDARSLTNGLRIIYPFLSPQLVNRNIQMTKKQCGVVWMWWTDNCGGGVWWKLWTHPLWMWCGSFERAAVSAVSSQPLSSTLFRHLQLNSTQFWPIVLFKRGHMYIHTYIYEIFKLGKLMYKPEGNWPPASSAQYAI